MKNTTSKNLSKNLLKYGALTSAIFGAAEMNGQIEYTDITDETINTGEDFVIDLNNDSTGDYLLQAFTANGGGLNTVIFAKESAAASSNSNSFAGISSSYLYPSNLNSGAMIDQNLNFLTGAQGTFNFEGCAYSNSQFCDGEDGFVGLKFKVAGNTHYGWARIQVAQDASALTIKDFAYNTTPDQGIEAGQQTLSIESKSFEGFTFSTDSDNNLFLSANSPINSIKIYDMLGKQVINNEISNNEALINLNNLSTGVYIAKVDIEGNTKTFKFTNK